MVVDTGGGGGVGGDDVPLTRNVGVARTRSLHFTLQGLRDPAYISAHLKMAQHVQRPKTRKIQKKVEFLNSRLQ